MSNGVCAICGRDRPVVPIGSQYGPGSFATCDECGRERAEPIGLATDPRFRDYKMRTFYKGRYVDSAEVEGHIFMREGKYFRLASSRADGCDD